MNASNLSHQFAVTHYDNVKRAMSEFDGACIDFAGEVVETVPHARLAYFDTPGNPRWKYHAAVELHGVIHDLWGSAPLPLEVFMREVGASTVDYF